MTVKFVVLGSTLHLELLKRERWRDEVMAGSGEASSRQTLESNDVSRASSFESQEGIERNFGGSVRC